MSVPNVFPSRISPVPLLLFCGIVFVSGPIPETPAAVSSLVQPEASAFSETQPGHQTTSPSAQPLNTATTTGDRAGASLEETAESVIETLLEILILGPLLLLLLGLLAAFPVVPLAVSLTMDGGCLRILLFGLGWLFSVFYGLIVGGLIAEGLLGLEFLATPIVQTFMWGYPMAAWWGHRRLESLPREQRLAWTQTLTGGALLGFGAGSVAGLLRSAAGAGSGFGGFGGGSFGGGGASGSWGSSGMATSTSSAAGSVPGVATVGTGSAGGASSAGAGAVVAGGLTDAASDVPPSDMPPSERSRWTRLRRWFQKFRWYHGLSFILTTLVFLPLGLGTMTALQNRNVLLFVLGGAVVYGAYKLIARPGGGTDHETSTSFLGGEASSTWR